jgi:hypothetical protein
MIFFRYIPFCIAIFFGSSPAFASRDFPLASCKRHNGTITEKSGVNTNKALIKGMITKADIQEYCERDPGGSTIKYGGKDTFAMCVEKIYRKEKDTQLIAIANCSTQVLTFREGNNQEVQVRFPLAPNSDQSCASGMPPLISQFKILCPAAANKMKM